MVVTPGSNFHTYGSSSKVDPGTTLVVNPACALAGAATVGAAWPIEPVGAAYRGEVAERWRYLDGRGEIGII